MKNLIKKLNHNQYIQDILNINDQKTFEDLAFQAFYFQIEQVPIYKSYAELVKKLKPSCLEEIPFLPIDFFKYHSIRSNTRAIETLFKSSGTTLQVRSHHYIESTEIYELSFLKAYEQFVGNPDDQIIIAVLPNYVEQDHSSLVYMVDCLIRATNNTLSGFYLYDIPTLLACYNQAVQQNKEVVLFGVTYALLDLAEAGVKLPQAKIIETGGMKGRRKEISKEELHFILKNQLEVSHIFSEYGMCELLSQAYADGTDFYTPNWMKILIRDKNDPFELGLLNKTGGINVIDLMNIYSCSFIQTQDLGKITNDSFTVLGRIDHSDIRGCNLLIE